MNKQQNGNDCIFELKARMDSSGKISVHDFDQIQRYMKEKGYTVSNEIKSSMADAFQICWLEITFTENGKSREDGLKKLKYALGIILDSEAYELKDISKKPVEKPKEESFYGGVYCINI